METVKFKESDFRYPFGTGSHLLEAIDRLKWNLRGRHMRKKLPNQEKKLGKVYLQYGEYYYPLRYWTVGEIGTKVYFFVVEIDFEHVLSTSEIKKLE